MRHKCEHCKKTKAILDDLTEERHVKDHNNHPQPPHLPNPPHLPHLPHLPPHPQPPHLPNTPHLPPHPHLPHHTHHTHRGHRGHPLKPETDNTRFNPVKVPNSDPKYSGSSLILWTEKETTISNFPSTLTFHNGNVSGNGIFFHDGKYITFYHSGNYKIELVGNIYSYSDAHIYLTFVNLDCKSNQKLSLFELPYPEDNKIQLSGISTILNFSKNQRMKVVISMDYKNQLIVLSDSIKLMIFHV